MKKSKICAKCKILTNKKLHKCKIMLDKLEDYPLCDKCYEQHLQECYKNREIIIGGIKFTF